MIPCLRVKDGVQFTVISPAGFHMLAALEQVAARISHDVTITSACDGEHSGLDDPHHRGEAYDVRTHDLPDANAALNYLKMLLSEAKFYAFLEDPATENEHIHVQLRHGILYP
jgi:hypothetical protein